MLILTLIDVASRAICLKISIRIGNEHFRNVLILRCRLKSIIDVIALVFEAVKPIFVMNETVFEVKHGVKTKRRRVGCSYDASLE